MSDYSVIQKSTYVTIANLYAEAVKPLDEVASYYLDAAETILQDNNMNVELDLLRPFYNAYLSASSIYGAAEGYNVATPASAVEAVRSLQQHVINRNTGGDYHPADGTGSTTQFTNVAHWLNSTADGGRVYRNQLDDAFYDLSKAAGYDIKDNVQN